MQSPRSIQKARTSFCRRSPDVREPIFANWVSQIRETKNRANGLLREDHYKPDNVPNGVRLEKPVAPPLPEFCRLPAGIRLLKNRFRTFAYWSWRRDLNPRPPDYKSGALPTELRQHSGNRALQAQVYP